MSRVKSYSHLTSFSRPIPDTGPCCSSSESLLHMHATHRHLINGSLEPKDVVFLISLEIADRCRKYGVTLLRRILLCAICSLYPGQKGAPFIQLREALALRVLGSWLCLLSLPAPTRSPLPHQEHQLQEPPGASPVTSEPQKNRNKPSLWCPQDLMWSRRSDPWVFAGNFASTKQRGLGSTPTKSSSASPACPLCFSPDCLMRKWVPLHPKSSPYQYCLSIFMF